MPNDIPTTTDIPLAEAAARLGVEVNEVEWFSWPETFGSTAGPNRGAGGQMLTQFQVFGFRPSGFIGGWKYCAGRWKPWCGEMLEDWRV